MACFVHWISEDFGDFEGYYRETRDSGPEAEYEKRGSEIAP